MSALDSIGGWPVDTVAAGWVRLDGERAVSGPVERVFPLASVTKPIFAYAVLVAIEEGSLALDQPAGPDGSTVRHLLAHASGLGDDRSEPLARVGRRRIYSNGGFELLGDLLAARTGFSPAAYFNGAVAEPLGLGATVVTGSVAHAAESSVDDLLVLATEWLAPTLIHPSTMAEAISPQFAELGGVLPGYGRQEPNPWGLGFEIKGTKTPHWTGATNSPATFGHFGRAGTFVWADPAAGVACTVLTDRDFGPWAAQRWPALSDDVLTEASS